MISRIEVIDRSKPLEEGGGRVYVNTNIKGCWQSLQDGGRTLKIFINEEEM
jgi:hypothetical protein